NKMATDVAGHRWKLTIYFVLFMLIATLASCAKDAKTNSGKKGNKRNLNIASDTRFLLYDCNPGEGFNLRRDVYIRIANLVKKLNTIEPWTLVLPPWGRLYHWKSNVEQMKIPWSLFFDIESLNAHIPVIEMEEYISVIGKPEVEEMYYLQRFKEGWNGGKWEEKLERRECLENWGYALGDDNNWHGWFWGYNKFSAKHFECLSVQMEACSMTTFLTKETRAKSVMLHRGEQLIHGAFDSWSSEWWSARRSLRFAKHLREVAADFRAKFLDSNDEKDNTLFEDDWRGMYRKPGEAKGGPYVAVHLRRRDFLYSHEKEVPSIEESANQLEKILDEQRVTKLFVASDMPRSEYDELKHHLNGYQVHRFIPDSDLLDLYKDGGIAIIDQIICSHAKYFVGTSVSTFSFRIHEERQILGFNPDMTYNRLCGKEEGKCDQPSSWPVKYPTNNKHTEL
ncbi:unnamed protein product, partial [Owenia fusiformis]